MPNEDEYLVTGNTIELHRPVPVQAYTWSSPDLPAHYWWVYPGAFKDRFPNDYAAIAASDHPVCRAFIALTADRLYIDLKGPVGQLFDSLIAAGQPEMTIEKKAVILAPPTTDYERFVKGLPDPVGE
jgi:hypothetical protein